MTFAPANQNILAWATLRISVLHHRISSVLCCNQNTNVMLGPKNDYINAYSHPLSNLSSCQWPLWSMSVFWLLNFLTFMPIQLPLANRRLNIWIFTWICLFGQSILKEGQIPLHGGKLRFLFIFLGLLWSWGHLLVYWSSVEAWCLSTIPTLCSVMPLFSRAVALPTELPVG